MSGLTSIKTAIEGIKKDFQSALGECVKAQTPDAYKRLHKQFLKTEVGALFSQLKTVDANEKREAGQAIHELRSWIESELSELSVSAQLASSAESKSQPFFDPAVTKTQIKKGQLHPLTKFYYLIEKVLVGMGFQVIQGPEIELEENNFEKLNIPPHHPARDMQDTFYIEGADVLLRSHTSSVQVRAMEKMKPPLMLISPGLVYRVDDIDPQHTPMFHQVEGLVVGEKITFADLKGVLITLFENVFGEKIKLRFRPSYYPYTEPSAAVDLSCIICNQAGCRTCGQSGWITILGAGMVHPNVFTAVGYDPDQYSGFAFGLGINRLAMIYYGLPEIRAFYENNMNLWQQL